MYMYIMLCCAMILWFSVWHVSPAMMEQANWSVPVCKAAIVGPSMLSKKLPKMLCVCACARCGARCEVRSAVQGAV